MKKILKVNNSSILIFFFIIQTVKENDNYVSFPRFGSFEIIF